MRDRRLRLYMVPEHLVFGLFAAEAVVRRSKDGILCLPEISNIPEGAEVSAVHYDFHTKCFAFIAYHPSFPVVPDGETIPQNYGEIRQSVFQIVREGSIVKFKEFL